MFKLKFVFGILPVIVHYTDKVKEGFAGTAQGPYVRIRPKYRHDKGLLEHELMHVKQGYTGLLTSIGIGLLLAQFIDFDYILETFFGIGVASHPLLYLLVTRYKLFAEVMAYAKQIQYCKTDQTDRFAGFIADKYDLDVDKEEVKKMLHKSMR